MLTRRVLAKMKYYFLKNIVLIIFYSCLFFFLFLFFIMYRINLHQIGTLEKTVGKSISIVKEFSKGNTSGIIGYSADELSKLLLDETIESYNRINYKEMVFVDIDPVISTWVVEKRYYDSIKLLEKQMGESYQETFPVIGLDDFITSQFSVGEGYQLLEGEVISKKHQIENVVMISDELAKKNHLQVGDVLHISNSKLDTVIEPKRELELKIVGVFALPETEKNTARFPNEDKSNVLFVPRDLFSNNNMLAPTIKLQVYFKERKDIEPYIKNKQMWYKEYQEESMDEAKLRFVWNKEKYDLLVRPLKDIQFITIMMLWIIGIGSLIIILLIGNYTVEKSLKEFQYLIQMGERRGRYMLQLLLEEMLPVIGAIFIATIFVTGWSEQRRESMMQENVSVQNIINEQRKELLVRKNRSEQLILTEIVEDNVTFANPYILQKSDMLERDIVVTTIGMIIGMAFIYIGQAEWRFRRIEI